MKNPIARLVLALLALLPLAAVAVAPGFWVIEYRASMQCARAFMPVDAVISGGRSRVSSGS